jgi:iron complex outermembrane receptor protein
MSTADIATLLKNLPPNSIARLEILRTPVGALRRLRWRWHRERGAAQGREARVLPARVNAVMSQGRYRTQSVGSQPQQQ